MNSDNTLSSWIDPLTREQMGDLLVTPSSPRSVELTPDEWWTKLKQTTEAIDTSPPASQAHPDSAVPPSTQAQIGLQGVTSPVTQRPETVARTTISAIRQQLDSLAPKPSTHQQSSPPTETLQNAESPVVSEDELREEPETPAARPPITPAFGNLQLPKPQPKADPPSPAPISPPVSTVPQTAKAPAKISSQTERALDRYNDWAKEYLSFSNICLLDEFGDLVAGHPFDSKFTAAASTLGNAFLNATQFRHENQIDEDEIHHFPHRAAHTPWEDQHMTVIPVRTLGGLIIVAGLTHETVDRRRACMAAETLLRVTGEPKN